MSVTFEGRTQDGIPLGDPTRRESPCLCAQDAPSWAYPLTDAVDREELRRHATPSCGFCKGSGIEMETEPSGFEMNLCNGNARALLALLGLAAAPSRDPLGSLGVVAIFDGSSDLCGVATLPELRRRIMVARARFDSLAPALTREAEVVHAPPRVQHKADWAASRADVIELRPVRAIVSALTAEDLRARLEAFAALVERVSAAGGAMILWS